MAMFSSLRQKKANDLFYSTGIFKENSPNLYVPILLLRNQRLTFCSVVATRAFVKFFFPSELYQLFLSVLHTGSFRLTTHESVCVGGSSRGPQNTTRTWRSRFKIKMTALCSTWVRLACQKLSMIARGKVGRDIIGTAYGRHSGFQRACSDVII